jgi:hypothetical protein
MRQACWTWAAAALLAVGTDRLPNLVGAEQPARSEPTAELRRLELGEGDASRLTTERWLLRELYEGTWLPGLRFQELPDPSHQRFALG